MGLLLFEIVLVSYLAGAVVGVVIGALSYRKLEYLYRIWRA